ncbi:hypothetical protein Verru16b_02065 [Lacunisphaera limnophila]|uniref:Sugar 3,4-ketoisomerase QdtA cupin domain-containing protein n=1 Tax=Lacunisphaera limnophila TaxID=1838286 RepID=A0A1D8AVV3_9BACT|nr:hypothetical protein [Lacunisphaera limnophila]AOS44996.1 hypothetical protein Verru16b_02065 [Lacunisphaera limnophila]
MNPGGVQVIPGGLHRDARGAVQHVNGFSFSQVDRFYCIAPAVCGEIRGWVGHQRDWKWFFVARGRFDLGYVKPRVWHEPAEEDRPVVLALADNMPQVVAVPPGHYTASRALEPGSVLLVFSSGRIETASEDDHRQPPGAWPLASGS